MSSFKERRKIEETIKKNIKKPQKRIVHKEPFFSQFLTKASQNLQFVGTFI